MKYFDYTPPRPLSPKIPVGPFEGTEAYWAFRDLTKPLAAQAQIIGFPYEGRASFRPGAYKAPDYIRYFSTSIETYSPRQDIDLADYLVVDRGNYPLPKRPLPEVLDEVRRDIQQRKQRAYFTLFLGGDHTSTLAFLGPDEVASSTFYLLVLDAHTDLRDHYEGDPYSHAAWARRALEWLGPDRMRLAGVRSGTRAEFTLGHNLGLFLDSPEAVVQWIQSLPRGAGLHVSLDIDVLDLSLVPGTGNPEPLGWTLRDLCTVFRALRQSPVLVRSADLVEYSPPYDATGSTGILAAWLAREMLLAFMPLSAE
ncbi:MAG: agmatinase [Chloroflexi bacterium]|nr:agmatinase [Chloroflexota bacterium]